MVHRPVKARMVIAEVIANVLPAVLATLLQLLAIFNAVGPILSTRWPISGELSPFGNPFAHAGSS